MKVWVLSPNVYNDHTEDQWKSATISLSRAFIAYDEDHKFGKMFKDEIKTGDIILVAQGQNSNKRFFIAGEVSSEARNQNIEHTPGEAQNRQLIHTIDKENLEALDLDFKGSKWGNSKQPATLYHLEPESNEKDRGIVQKLVLKIQNIKMQSKANKLNQLLEQKKQIILQGPPGTGKTYTAKDLAELLIFDKVSVDKKEQGQLLGEADQFELVQFHPSYSYEDFVRGITANSEKGQIIYQVKDQILGSFAEKARKNQDASKKNIVEFNRRAWAEEKLIEFGDEVQEIINIEGKYKLTDAVSIVEVEADAFRYTGQNWKSDLLDRMKFSDIIEGYIENVNSPGDYRALESISRTAYQRYSYFYKVLERFKENLPEEPEIPKAEKPELKNYVLVIDEINRANLPAVLGELIYALEYRGEAVQSLYEKDGDRDIVLPENLYIIGTMNTADRSVGHIDYAIRRRFAFVEMLPTPLELGDDFQTDAFKAISELFVKEMDKDKPSDHISDEFKERPQDVWIGHSYFIANEEAFPMRLQYEIIPILEEYLKDGILNSDAKEVIKKLENQYLNNA